MNTSPRISVVVPVYNAEKYLGECLRSLLVQKIDFECLIIENGSSDASLEIAKKFASEYENFKVITSKPRDLSQALNAGISLARAGFIARIDADDMAHPTRLVDQLNYLEENSECVLVGGRLEYVDSQGVTIGIQENLKTGKLVVQDFLSGNPLAHPSVMFRKNSFIAAGPYRTKWNKVEDLDLWLRLIKVGELHNMNTIATKYRIHQEQVSISKEAARMEIKFRVIHLFVMASHREQLMNQLINIKRIVQIFGVLYPRAKDLAKKAYRF